MGQEPGKPTGQRVQKTQFGGGCCKALLEARSCVTKPQRVAHEYTGHAPGALTSNMIEEKYLRRLSNC